MSAPSGPRVAAIDCGTNAIRLLVADVVTDPGRVRLVDFHREQRIVRLGEGVDATGMLTTHAIDRTWAALADYVAAIRAAGVLDVRMAATSALRDAGNADEFAAMVRSTLGQDPEVLSGMAEAELGFLGTSADLDAAAGSVVVIDIGGGSTELVVGRPPVGDAAATVTGAVSLDVGAVRITERILQGDPPTEPERTAATRWVTGQMTAALDRLDLSGVGQLVAVAGTAMTVAAAALGHHRLDPAMLHLAAVPIDAIDRATGTLLAATRAHRAALRYVHPGRVDVIGGGALILRTTAELLRQRTGRQELTVSDHDILDGLALSQVAR